MGYYVALTSFSNFSIEVMWRRPKGRECGRQIADTIALTERASSGKVHRREKTDIGTSRRHLRSFGDFNFCWVFFRTSGTEMGAVLLAVTFYLLRSECRQWPAVRAGQPRVQHLNVKLTFRREQKTLLTRWWAVISSPFSIHCARHFITKCQLSWQLHCAG